METERWVPTVWLEPLAVVAVILVVGLCAAALLARTGVSATRSDIPGFRPRAQAEHEHDFRQVAREWVAGKEVHVMVCWQHEHPVIERREVG